jgi:sugar phosphate isomerase/epimerase
MFSSMTRRRLLQTSLTGSVLAATANVSGFTGNRFEPRMRFGLVTYLWGRDMDLATVISSCEQSGMLGVELRTQHKHGVEPALTKKQRSEVRKRFADSPVELVGYGSNCEFHSADPGKVKANIEQAKQFVQLMHDCGGTGVKVKPNGFPGDVPRQKTIDQIGRSLNEVAEYGQEYGQKIRVEVHGRATSEISVMRDIFEVADHPNVYVCWNSNKNDLAGDGLAANFNMVSDRFGDTIHVHELNTKDYPYAELLKLFSQIDYDGWILLEASSNPTDKIAAMKEQLAAFNRLIS